MWKSENALSENILSGSVYARGVKLHVWMWGEMLSTWLDFECNWRSFKDSTQSWPFCNLCKNNKRSLLKIDMGCRECTSLPYCRCLKNIGLIVWPHAFMKWKPVFYRFSDFIEQMAKNELRHGLMLYVFIFRPKHLRIVHFDCQLWINQFWKMG